jgi:phage baseplate assembly protein gpV
LRGTAEGDTRLQPGAKATVSGLAQALCGDYVLTGVTHIIDRKSGYVAELDTAPPTAPERNRATVVTWGRVTAVDDPEQTGRVRVVLPSYGDIETEWIQVVVPGAGAEKGLVALPDADDQVLVLIIDQNPAQAVVLGGLYGTNRPKDPGVEDGAVCRFTFTTAGGQQMQLDDINDRVRIENSNSDFIEMEPEKIRFGDSQGSLIELTPELCRIHATADLNIEAPGKRITISGQAIDFEKA